MIPNPYWFPRECCEKHRAYDKRQAGLFNIEKDHGQEMVALCSKTYVLEDRDGFCKTALKGLEPVLEIFIVKENWWMMCTPNL